MRRKPPGFSHGDIRRAPRNGALATSVGSCYVLSMHRVVAIQFTPASARQWHLHGEVRREAAKLWCRLTKLHARIRKTGWKSPTESKLRNWAKSKFPRLHSQSAQEIIAEFLEAVNSTRQKRKQGDDTARYPWRRMHYRD